jgi:hypothetical protein
MAFSIKQPNEKAEKSYVIEMGKVTPEQEKAFKGWDKAYIKKNEKLAGQLMRIDNSIWRKHGWRSGSAVDNSVYKVELKEELDKKGIKEIPYLQYHIFEDANYHTLNKNLEELGAFKKGESYASSEKEFEEYSFKGGKTWEL